jgi:hypothetical protein
LEFGTHVTGGDHEMKFQLKKGILGGMGELNKLHEEAPQKKTFCPSSHGFMCVKQRLKDL